MSQGYPEHLNQQRGETELVIVHGHYKELVVYKL